MKAKKLPEPELDQLDRDHLIVLIRRHMLFINQRELASVVWEVESKKSLERLQAAQDACSKATDRAKEARAKGDQAAQIRAHQDWLKANDTWTEEARWIDQVQAYYDRWLMNPPDESSVSTETVKEANRAREN